MAVGPRKRRISAASRPIPIALGRIHRPVGTCLDDIDAAAAWSFAKINICGNGMRATTAVGIAKAIFRLASSSRVMLQDTINKTPQLNSVLVAEITEKWR